MRTHVPRALERGTPILRPVRREDREYYGGRLQDPDIAVAVEAQSRFLAEGRTRLYLVIGAFALAAFLMMATVPI